MPNDYPSSVLQATCTQRYLPHYPSWLAGTVSALMIMTLLNAILSPLFCHNFDQTQSISTILRHSRYRISAGNTETSLNPAQVSKTIRPNSAILNTGTNVQNQSATSAASFIFKVLSSRYNPLLAQMVVTRRCNLSCGYCNEYDDFSPPCSH